MANGFLWFYPGPEVLNALKIGRNLLSYRGEVIMAVYRSSRLEFEFERFLSRCPKLASVPRLSSLLKEVLGSHHFLFVRY